ncbi:vitamin B12 import ATP-binding protein BtuD [Sideroxyarcus emersonii]|uniref:Cyclolysin secretion/processing ATP-binding protein CyaB n=2 Tax=Sideroxyarcus emersonii TaxID=2764705 RepID=A0AAN2BYN3_9PROT|nr:peptidase domain-containing ABC transporter [Sideroxyarcus emersonii]BCK87233.1 vitamin B12 import ATP-binding protein BtuD [Sideroxyarcus emersonii]
MPRRLLKIVSNSLSREPSCHAPKLIFRLEDVVWVMGSFCALNRKPFDAELLAKQFPPPYTSDSFIHAARALGFRIKRRDCDSATLPVLNMPCLVVLNEVEQVKQSFDEDVQPEANEQLSAPHIKIEVSTGTAGAGARMSPIEPSSLPRKFHPAIVVQMTTESLILFEVGTNTPKAMTQVEFATRFAGVAFQLALETKGIMDPDSILNKQAEFGFNWFIPELLKHKRIWRDVLIASLIIQLLGLVTPLFTQAIIDKVVVHRTQSTLIAIAIALAVFMVFSALLSWVRQYLILHTGNRVDAVLGHAVFEHLFKLPPRYFEQRPTGVIAARLHGVETIREFIASAAVTLILDFPFLLIFLAMMLYYSLLLTCIALAIMSLIVIMSIIVAPMFRTKLNEQFMLGARNQAFTTEYVGGLETVKSLQMEPQLNARYSDYLAEYLRCGFNVRQIGNTYNVVSNGLEQMMTLLILVVGAYTVMNSSDFSIGMLIAFQMYASKISQPMLRLVGLWQQFQQANMSVQRLGDIMNAPVEPYSVLPSRMREGKGHIDIEALSFRYAEDRPFLYQNFNLKVAPGKVVAIMGPSGSGKSTLTKLLQGFYQPASGTIKIDSNDIRYLSANELRHYFGVVLQETVLFSGTIYDNLMMANPHTTFDQIVQCCKMAEIHSAIEALPQGYQTEIGERGVGLSGGQKQRLSIARALIKQPRILVFDEATSSLDSNTAEHFATTINQLKGKVSMLFITHAMPKNLLVDEVVWIGQGSLSAVSDLNDQTKQGVEGGVHG